MCTSTHALPLMEDVMSRRSEHRGSFQQKSLVRAQTILFRSQNPIFRAPNPLLRAQTLPLRAQTRLFRA